jgi:hypothetical protein
MFRFVTYVIDPREFLPILYEELRDENASFVEQEIKSFEELQKKIIQEKKFDYIVNCAGAGSLFFKKSNEKNNSNEVAVVNDVKNHDDDEMLKIRGDVLIFNRKKILQNNEKKIDLHINENSFNSDNNNEKTIFNSTILRHDNTQQLFQDLVITTTTNRQLFEADEQANNNTDQSSFHDYENGKLAYVVLSDNLILLGGTYMDEKETVEKTFFQHSDEMRVHIFNKCRTLIPETFPVEVWNRLERVLLNDEEVIHAIGFRPKHVNGVQVRASSDEDKIINNFGHSGSGWTMCWGSAQKVVDIIDSKLIK